MTERTILSIRDASSQQNFHSETDRLHNQSTEKLPDTTSKGAAGNPNLPPLELTGPEFVQVAEQMFDRLNTDHNRGLSQANIYSAFAFPSSIDTAKTRRAIKIMYDHYDFLKDLSYGGTEGITVIGLENSLDKKELNRIPVKKASTTEAVLLGAGLFSIPMAGVGVAAIVGEQAELGWLATFAWDAVGAAIGTAIPVGIAAGVYGIKKGLNYYSQRKEKNSFLHEFKSPQ